MQSLHLLKKNSEKNCFLKKIQKKTAFQNNSEKKCFLKKIYSLYLLNETRI